MGPLHTVKLNYLEKLYAEHGGKVSDKWSSYLPIYSLLFEKFRNSTISLLEIGIQNGGSLEIWSKYFKNANLLIGCDVNPACSSLLFDSSNIKVVVGDANLDSTKKVICQLSDRFDIIIDDGSHRSDDIIKSFVKYFPLLKNGGVYLIEDLHCSYWNEFGGGLYDPNSSISFFKALIDAINLEHWGLMSDQNELLMTFIENFNLQMDDFNVGEIYSVEFLNSVCVVSKRTDKENSLGSRIISGKFAEIVTEPLYLAGTSSAAPNQTDNKMSYRPKSSVEVLDAEIANLEQIVSNQRLEISRISHELSSVTLSNSWRLTTPLRSIRRLLTKIR